MKSKGLAMMKIPLGANEKKGFHMYLVQTAEQT